MLGTLAPFLFQRPAAVGVDNAVDLGHEADRFVEGHDDAVVMDKIGHAGSFLSGAVVIFTARRQIGPDADGLARRLAAAPALLWIKAGGLLQSGLNQTDHRLIDRLAFALG